jgi:iron complex outermembrane receptor protein
MTMTLKSRLLGAAMPVALMLMSTGALAQGESVETVTVTARRVAERLQDVPLSVTAVGAGQLENASAENIGELQGLVPNLNIAQGRGSNSSANIFIRGVGQPDALATFDPAVGVYVDDVYISRIRGALLDTFQVERIEVLRGPQGTLYGKNTIGGALKVYTYQPTEAFEGAASAVYGTFNNWELRGRVTGPISDTAGFALMGYWAARDGYIDDPVLHREYNDKDAAAVRGTVSFTPNDRTSIVISADYTRESPSLYVGKPENTLIQTDFFFGPVVLFTPDSGEYDFKTRTTPGFPNDDNYLHHSGVSATLTYNLSDAWTFKSISAMRNLNYRDYVDIDATQFELGDVLVAPTQHQYSQEFQFLYSGERWRAVVGAYWLREVIKSHQEAYADDLFAFAGTLVTFTRFIDDRQEMDSLAGFASVDYDFAPNWMISLGVRWTYEGKEYDRFTSTLSNIPGLSTPVLDFGFHGDESWEDWSPSATLRFTPQENVMLYARVAKGFKSGGFNGRANSSTEPRVFDPETLWSYEAGFKTSWHDGRLVLNGDVFYNDYRNFQARVARGDSLTPIFGIINAGKLQQYGAELELIARPVEHLTIQAALGYLHAEYEEFLDPRFPAGDPRIDRSWQDPAFSPEWTFRIGALYTILLGDTGTLDLIGDAAYRSKMALAVDNSDLTTHAEFPGMFQSSYWLLNARVQWLDASGRYGVALFGRNLADEVYRVDAQEFSNVGGIRTSYFGMPQTFGIEASVKF